MIDTRDAPITISTLLEGGRIVETIYRYPGYSLTLEVKEVREIKL